MSLLIRMKYIYMSSRKDLYNLNKLQDSYLLGVGITGILTFSFSNVFEVLTNIYFYNQE